MVETEAPQTPMMSQSWVALVVVVVIGVFSLVSLWMGFQSYGGEHPEQATYYIIIGTAGFAAIGYMFFRNASRAT